MVTTFDVASDKLIKEASEQLKKVESIKPPEWVPFVKTGSHNERVPDNPDWWYVRAASILRKVYISPVGVDRLRTVYGGRKNKGYKPEKRRNASGNIIRKCLQQLEKAGLVRKLPAGRGITPQGQKFLDNIAYKVSKAE
ncbi:MAG: 30S ribosomal protein S19e [archaeon]|nr:30S ribosomal protein S19e [archaeon]